MAEKRGGGIAYYRRKKRPDGARWALTFRLTLLTLLIGLACLVRFAETPGLLRLKESIRSVVRTDGDYRGALAVVGRAVAGESEGENVVAVFGRKLLGLEEQAEAPPEKAPEEEPAATDPSAPPEGQQGGGSGLEQPPGPDEQPDQAEAGDFSGFALEGSYASEAVLPVFVLSHELLGQSLLWDEMDDDTPNEDFEIPSPDNVDDTVYTLDFAYAAPAKGRVSSYFGYRIHPISGNTTFHHGADLAIAAGSTVKAFAAGTVAETGCHSVYGNYVKLSHPDGFLTLYAHLEKVLVKKGKKVKLGDKIALSGNSGYSTGAHLHFELRRSGKILNPFNYLSFD